MNNRSESDTIKEKEVTDGVKNVKSQSEVLAGKSSADGGRLRTGVSVTYDFVNTADSIENSVAETTESVENTADTVSDETIEIETKMFNDIVNEIENDDTVSGKKGKHYYVSKHTPEIIVKKADIEDLPMIISFETLYLAVRENGELKGHYHGLGSSNTKNCIRYFQTLPIF